MLSTLQTLGPHNRHSRLYNNRVLSDFTNVKTEAQRVVDCPKPQSLGVVCVQTCAEYNLSFYPLNNPEMLSSLLDVTQDSKVLAGHGKAGSPREPVPRRWS